MDKLSPAERMIFRSLRTPAKIQDYLNSLASRTDEREPIVRSPRTVIKHGSASCMEGALLAAAILAFQGKRPLLLDLQVGKATGDCDHVVALFQKGGAWGALSKTSHPVLRYREPVYKNIRELAMSYFHEYFTDDGKKNLRSFSEPFDVTARFGDDWMIAADDLYEIAAELDDSPHTSILNPAQIRGLRDADPIERTAGQLKENTKKLSKNKRKG